MKVILGLGNPGLRFKFTRHNVGFLVVAHLARAQRIRIHKKSCNCSLGIGLIAGEEVLLGLPLTFMNLSGAAVASVVKSKKIALKDLLIICDDVHLPLGVMRLRPQGSDGGHKGLRSIIQELGTDQFARLRIGVGLPQKERVQSSLTQYVLGRFNKKETKTVKAVIGDAARCSEIWASRGITCAMNKSN